MTRCVIYLMMPQGERGGERKTLGLVFLLPVGSMTLLWGLGWRRMSEQMVHIVPPDDNQRHVRTLGFLQGGLHQNLHRKDRLAFVNPFSLWARSSSPGQLVLFFCASAFKSPPGHAL